MRSLRNATIVGDRAAVANVRNLFGHIDFASAGLGGAAENGPPVTLRITRVLANCYKVSDATPESAPLYILVPDTTITLVWTGTDHQEIRYGTAMQGDKPITGAVCIFKGTCGLYFCLTPAGEQIDDTGALGI